MIGLVFTISSVCSTKRFLFYAGLIKKQPSWQAKKQGCTPLAFCLLGNFSNPRSASRGSGCGTESLLSISAPVFLFALMVVILL